MDREARPGISVVVPVYRNARTLEELHARLRRVLMAIGAYHEMLFVNDACRRARWKCWRGWRPMTRR